MAPALVKDVFECAQSAFDAEAVAGMAAGQVTALSDDTARALAAASGRIQRATGDSYKSFKALLEKNVPNKQNYGERVVPFLPYKTLNHAWFFFFFFLFVFLFFSFSLLCPSSYASGVKQLGATRPAAPGPASGSAPHAKASSCTRATHSYLALY